jgi:cell division septation protein DedD
MDRGALRNIEQLQEDDAERRTPARVTLLFVVLGGACIVFAALLLSGRRTEGPAKRADPLGDLVAKRNASGNVVAVASSNPRATDLSTREVTFPSLLSDSDRPTTALAAMRSAPTTANVLPPARSERDRADMARAGDGRETAAAPLGADRGRDEAVTPPPPTDRLPVVPLPAQNVLQPSPIVTRPRDTLTKTASEAAQITAPAQPQAAEGHEGGWQLQVSSFRSQAEAQAFADQLRARNHKAHVVEAHVPNRGTWFRVRIGPFASQEAAAGYRVSFEQKEHVVPFIVTPERH